jgi:hypothetical protein
MESFVVLALDHLEVFRLMDTWLRQVLVPELDERVRVVLAGREPSVAAWFAAGWEGLSRSLALGPLVDEEAELLLPRRGHEPQEARRLNRIAHGASAGADADVGCGTRAARTHPRGGRDDPGGRGPGRLCCASTPDRPSVPTFLCRW